MVGISDTAGCNVAFVAAVVAVAAVAAVAAPPPVAGEVTGVRFFGFVVKTPCGLGSVASFDRFA